MGKRIETAHAIAKETLSKGAILQVETNWYGRSMTFTAGPYRTAVGFKGYAVFVYGGGSQAPLGIEKTKDVNEVAWWVAEHARIPDIREAIAKAMKSRN